jgi:hypothetical protein
MFSQCQGKDVWLLVRVMGGHFRVISRAKFRIFSLRKFKVISLVKYWVQLKFVVKNRLLLFLCFNKNFRR